MQQLHRKMLRARVDVGYELDCGAVCAVSVGHDGRGWVRNDVVIYGMVDVERNARGVFYSSAQHELR